MTAVNEFAVNQQAYNDKMVASVAEITADVQTLKDLIEKIQNSPGAISAEDQASLDQASQKSKDLSDKLDQLHGFAQMPGAGVVSNKNPSIHR